NAANRMQSIRGKRQKEAVREFSQPLFFRFHCARGAVFRFLYFHAEAISFDTIVCRTLGPGAMPLVGAGVIPLPRGTGGE
ncbi:MAG: hypothetical protein IJN44_08785, partial [Clostridia bacterium]|nr:hypothetical protein [Clostridia bacterium]